ncbi:hypothetical protein ACQPXH_20405 [Nocardia sp. CA-135953]|uniref:hypothetical protein n=1 Tax=Nocardia sp. CA-135953 TaxID=3239978 RepID=UPI003D986FB3
MQQLLDAQRGRGEDHVFGGELMANGILTALAPVCDSNPGVVLNDARTHYRPAPGPVAARPRVIVWGTGEVAAATLTAAEHDPAVEVVGHGLDDLAEVLALESDCVLVAADAAPVLSGVAEEDVLALLECGRNVVCSGSPASPERLAEACELGAARGHTVGGHANPIAERVIPTLARRERGTAHQFRRSARPAHRVDGRCDLTRRGYIGDRHVLTHDICHYDGPDHAFRGEGLPLGGFTDPAGYTIQITGTRAIFHCQLASEPLDRPNVAASILARALLDAIPAVAAGSPGIISTDPTPHFKMDDRIHSASPKPEPVLAGDRHGGV